MSTPFIGQICFFPWSWTPEGWFPCDGTLRQINQYPALFSLIGTIYGGSQQQGTFALPNLRGRVPVGLGLAQSPGATEVWSLGHAAGQEAVALTSQTYLPSHTHTISIGGVAPGTGTATAGAMLTTVVPNQWFAAPLAAANTTLSPQALSPAYGPGQAHENRQPYLVLNACIAYDGEYPDFDN